MLWDFFESKATEVQCLGVFFLLKSRTVRVVRALNRQRIMEIQAERLANGNIMATDCLGQLGHANEAAIISGRGENRYVWTKCWPEIALYQYCDTDIHVYGHTGIHKPTHTHTKSEGLKPADRSELSARGPSSSGEPEISPALAPLPLIDVNRQHVILHDAWLSSPLTQH